MPAEREDLSVVSFVGLHFLSLQRVWVRRVLLNNIRAYDALSAILFERIFKQSKAFHCSGSGVRKMQEVRSVSPQSPIRVTAAWLSDVLPARRSDVSECLLVCA